MMNEKGANRRASNDVYSSWWFRKFGNGFSRRMRYISKRDKWLSLSVMVKMLKVTEKKITKSSERSNEKHKQIVLPHLVLYNMYYLYNDVKICYNLLAFVKLFVHVERTWNVHSCLRKHQHQYFHHLGRRVKEENSWNAI